MTDESLPTWADLESFTTEDPRRVTAAAVSYGTVLEPGADVVPEEWELLWFPGTGELVGHRTDPENPGVRLVGRAPHPDYITAVIDEDDRHDQDVAVHRRRWDVTHPDQPASRRRLRWRGRSGAARLRAALASWEQLMDGRHVDGLDDEPLPDWGHTADHVSELQWHIETWDDLGPSAAAAVDEAIQLERLLRSPSPFNLAAAANLAAELHTGALNLHRALLEAYGTAHRNHPGHQAN